MGILKTQLDRQTIYIYIYIFISYNTFIMLIFFTKHYIHTRFPCIIVHSNSALPQYYCDIPKYVDIYCAFGGCNLSWAQVYRPNVPDPAALPNICLYIYVRTVYIYKNIYIYICTAEAVYKISSQLGNKCFSFLYGCQMGSGYSPGKIDIWKYYGWSFIYSYGSRSYICDLTPFSLSALARIYRNRQLSCILYAGFLP